MRKINGRTKDQEFSTVSRHSRLQFTILSLISSFAVLLFGPFLSTCFGQQYFKSQDTHGSCHEPVHRCFADYVYLEWNIISEDKAEIRVKHGYGGAFHSSETTVERFFQGRVGMSYQIRSRGVANTLVLKRFYIGRYNLYTYRLVPQIEEYWITYSCPVNHWGTPTGPPHTRVQIVIKQYANSVGRGPYEQFVTDDVLLRDDEVANVFQ